MTCPCARKETLFFHRYPAYDRIPALPRSEPSEEGDATCIHHPRHKAVAVCADSGVFLCGLCAIPHRGVTLSPAAYTARQNRELQKTLHSESRAVMFDNIALGLVLVPLLLVFTLFLAGMAFVTIFTAPAALILTVLAWRRHPCGLLPRSRVRFVLAVLLALFWIAVWVIGITFFVTNL